MKGRRTDSNRDIFSHSGDEGGVVSAGIIARNLYGLYRVAYNDLAQFNSEKEAHR